MDVCWKLTSVGDDVTSNSKLASGWNSPEFGLTLNTEYLSTARDTFTLLSFSLSRIQGFIISQRNGSDTLLEKTLSYVLYFNYVLVIPLIRHHLKKASNKPWPPAPEVMYQAIQICK